MPSWVLRTDQWVVEIARAWVDAAGIDAPGDGPWVVVTIFDNERDARSVVAKMIPLAGEHNIQCRSGAQVLEDRGTALPTQP